MQKAALLDARATKEGAHFVGVQEPRTEQGEWRIGNFYVFSSGRKGGSLGAQLRVNLAEPYATDKDTKLLFSPDQMLAVHSTAWERTAGVIVSLVCMQRSAAAHDVATEQIERAQPRASSIVAPLNATTRAKDLTVDATGPDGSIP